MAADQRIKRLIAGSIGSSHELRRAKKKKVGLLKHGFYMRSNVSLEWDEKKKSVVAKREQIGLTWRDLIPFFHMVPCCNSVLADVLDVPREIFELENLSGVLSYEVWQTHLSESERNYLRQFLPNGAETQGIVQELLEGDNLHFGNPFLKWGTSLCLSNLHPDDVLQKEQLLKERKKLFYSDLEQYHNSMIGNLLMWKERWASSEDPENQILQQMWRSRKHAEISTYTHANETRYHDVEDDLATTSESSSWVADDKAVSSDNQSLAGRNRERQSRKGFTNNYEILSTAQKMVEKPREGQKLQKQNIQCSDGAKYMSYIKVSKEQHQRVMSTLKQSSNSIQSRSLNRLLGDLNTFHVQPFEVFEEEEWKKLHEHWLRLVSKDLPVAFANWRRQQSQRWELIQSLEQEIGEKQISTKEVEDVENAPGTLQNLMDHRTASHETMNTDEDQMDDGAGSSKRAFASKDEQEEKPDSIIKVIMDGTAARHESGAEDFDEPAMGDNGSIPASTQSQHPQQISSLSDEHEFHTMDFASGDNVIPVTDDIPPHVSEYPESLNCVPVGEGIALSSAADIHPHLSEYPEDLNSSDITASQGGSLSSTRDIWATVNAPESYYNRTSGQEYASTRELPWGHSRVIEDRSARMINLESGIHEGGSRKNSLDGQSSDKSFFNLCMGQQVQDGNELLQHFFKGQESLPYHHERKQAGLDFQPANVSMESSMFSGHFGEQMHPSLPLETRQKRLKDLYIPQDIEEKMFSDGVKYSNPRQEHFSSVTIQDWAVNSIRMPTALQSHLSDGQLGQNWFYGEPQVRGNWSGLDCTVGPTHMIGSGSNADQSLYGVASHCGELPSGAPYGSMGSIERLIPSGTFGGLVGGMPIAGNVLSHMVHPPDYLGGPEAAAPVKNDLGRMRMSHQNSPLQDSGGKPFLGSWRS